MGVIISGAFKDARRNLADIKPRLQWIKDMLELRVRRTTPMNA